MIINLTQHLATPDQIAAGVVDLPAEVRADLIDALTFSTMPTEDEILERAEAIATIAVRNGLGGEDFEDPLPEAAMIGGAGWILAPLEAALREVGIRPKYSFSLRVSTEETRADGVTVKKSEHRHTGFVEAVSPHAIRQGLTLSHLRDDA